MLRNGLVCLRAVNLSDLNLLYKVINDPDLIRYNATYKQVHEIEHIKWFKRLVKDKTRSFFIIEFKKKIVGAVQLIDIQSVHRNAEVTIRLFSEKNFGKKIGSQALSILCNHCFDNLNLHRIWLRVFADNHRAINTYKKIGFREEGVMREAAFIEGDYKNIIIMAKLKNE